MGTPRFGPRRAASAIAFAVATGIALALAAPAVAATGDVLADLTPEGGTGGRSVAFDGTHLYYTDFAGAVLHRIAADGSGHTQTPIVGAAGISALTYDVTRDAFWAVDATGLGIYLIERDGTASRYFTIDPATELPGLCDVAAGCSSIVSGLAYDARGDTLWYAPVGTQRVYHFDTIGHALGFFDTNELASTFFPDCASSGVGGIAAGRDSLYVAASDCARVFRLTKSDDNTAGRIESIPSPGPSGADVECDDVSFAADALWVRDALDGHIRAIEIQTNSCGGGGGVPMNPHGQWFTGGGTSPEHPIPLGEIAVHHGFVLWCDRAEPQRLHLSWTDVAGQHHTFQLVAVDQITCFDSPFVIQDPPQSSVDTTEGNGFGRIDGSSCTVTNGGPSSGCGTVEWSLIDGGEGNDTPPSCGTRLPEMDAVMYHVHGTGRYGETDQTVACLLDGNVQAHG